VFDVLCSKADIRNYLLRSALKLVAVETDAIEDNPFSQAR